MNWYPEHGRGPAPQKGGCCSLTLACGVVSAGMLAAGLWHLVTGRR